MLIRRMAAIFFCTFPLIALFPGCSDDETTCPPCESELGRIEGEVMAAGRPVGGTIAALHLPNRLADPIAEAMIDSAGQYSLRLPPGDYVLRAELEFQTPPFAYDGTLSDRNADTIRVTAGGEPERVDIRLGSVRVKAQTPPEWEGLNIRAHVTRSASYQFLAYVGSAFARDGRVEVPIPLIVPGDYRIYLENSRQDGFYLPLTYAIDEAEWVTVGVEEETVYESPIPVPSPGFIEGKVVGSWQTLGRYPPRYHVDPMGFERGYRACEADGSFRVAIYGSVEARVQIAVGGIRRWVGGTSIEDATVFDPEPGETIDLEIVESGIGGMLRPGECEVRIYDEAGEELGHAYSDDRTGRFSLSNLVPGVYYLRISSGNDWIAHWYDHAETRETATPIEISAEGETVWIEPHLLEGGSIRGQVLASSGGPIHVADLLVFSDADSSRILRRSQSAGPDGAFHVRGLENGAYTLVAETASYGRIWYPGVWDWNDAEPIRIENHEEVSGVVIRFP